MRGSPFQNGTWIMSVNWPFNDGSPLASVGLEVVLGDNLEVYLVQVKFVVLVGSILDRPAFDRSLFGHNGGRIVVASNTVLSA